MTIRAAKGDAWGGGLTPRVVLFLSIALLPIGLLAIVQTREYQRAAYNSAELALMAVTEQAVSNESEIIEKAVGATVALAAVVDDLSADPEACSARLQRLIDMEPRYAFAGYIPENGIMECSSEGETIDMSSTKVAGTFAEQPRRLITTTRQGLISGEWVVSVTEPVFVAGDYVGRVSISILQRVLGAQQAGLPAPGSSVPRGLHMAIFNTDGEIISSRSSPETNVDGYLPQQDLAQLAEGGARTFRGDSRTGNPRLYALSPIVPGSVYAIGTLDRRSQTTSPTALAASSAVFPVLMWLTSLVVAYYAFHRLVIGHVHALRRKMRAFGRSRRMIETPQQDSMPAEFREIDAEFMAMAESILRDEAKLENAVREKNVLLKEVNHRVKNNLQLISSIMSMNRRRADTEETAAVLGRLQDRILSLAAIHRNLYQAEDVGAVAAERLIRDITAQQGFGPGGDGDISLELEPVMLLPNQAVPLSLLVAEALSNARAHAGPGGGADIRLVLERLDGEMFALTISNRVEEGDPAEGTDGLGRHLIAAFVDQIGGDLETSTEDGRYVLRTRFAVLSQLQEPPDF